MFRLSATALALLLIVTSAGCDTVDSNPGTREPETDVYSFSLTFHLETADVSTDGYVSSHTYDVDIPRSVVRNGAVLAYYWEEETWTALPLTIGLEKPDEPVVDYTVTFGYAYEYNELQLFLESSSNHELVWNAERDEMTQIAELFGGGVPVKVVVIDSFGGVRRSQVDLNDYEAVRAYYGLEE